MHLWIFERNEALYSALTGINKRFFYIWGVFSFNAAIQYLLLNHYILSKTIHSIERPAPIQLSYCQIDRTLVVLNMSFHAMSRVKVEWFKGIYMDVILLFLIFLVSIPFSRTYGKARWIFMKYKRTCMNNVFLNVKIFKSSCHNWNNKM